MSLFLRISLLGSLFLLIFGCAQRKSDVGANSITGQPVDSFVVAVAQCTQSASWIPDFTTGGSQSLHIGSAKGFLASAVIRFEPDLELPDSFRVDSLSTMQVRFHRNRVWPSDANGDLRITMREITEPWVEADLIPDTLLDYDTFPVLDSGLVVRAVDTVSVFDVPRQLWERWLASDTTTYGLLFEARFEDIMLEWYSAEYINAVYPEYPPALLVTGQTWRPSDSTWVDSSFSIQAAHDGFIVKDTAPRDPKRVYISQGYAGRAAFFFPMDSITSVYTRTVVRAELQIFADTSNSAAFNFVEGQNILFKNGSIVDTSWVAARDSSGFVPADRITPGLESTASGQWDSTNTKFTLDLTSLAASWVSSPHSNGGVQVFSSGSATYLDRVVFYNQLADSADQRPRLIIWYTESDY